MNVDHDKMIHLQLVLIGLIESPEVADPTRDLVEKAARQREVVELLRDRCAENAVFRSFDHVLDFDTVEDSLDEAIQVFLSRSPRYGIRNSGLCLIVGAIAHNCFAVCAKERETAEKA